jgi:hypothetical protein
MRIAKQIPNLTKSDEARFWAKIDATGGNSACWNWKGALSGDGYGRFKVAGSLFSPHRIAHHIVNGPIPPKMAKCLVLHSCDNPACCNPAHLRLGTGSQNNRDAIRAGHWTSVEVNLPRIRFARLRSTP